MFLFREPGFIPGTYRVKDTLDYAPVICLNVSLCRQIPHQRVPPNVEEKISQSETLTAVSELTTGGLLGLLCGAHRETVVY